MVSGSYSGCSARRRKMPSRVIAMSCLIGLAITVTTGCTTAPIPPTYTREERRAKCLRTNGWWRSNLFDGFCEYRGPS